MSRARDTLGIRDHLRECERVLPSYLRTRISSIPIDRPERIRVTDTVVLGVPTMRTYSACAVFAAYKSLDDTLPLPLRALCFHAADAAGIVFT